MDHLRGIPYICMPLANSDSYRDKARMYTEAEASAVAARKQLDLPSSEMGMVGCSGMWCFRMWCFNMLV